MAKRGEKLMSVPINGALGVNAAFMDSISSILRKY